MREEMDESMSWEVIFETDIALENLPGCGYPAHPAIELSAVIRKIPTASPLFSHENLKPRALTS